MLEEHLAVLSWMALPVVLVLAWFTPRLGDAWLGPLERLAARFAARKTAVLVAAPLVVIALRLAFFRCCPYRRRLLTMNSAICWQATLLPTEG